MVKKYYNKWALILGGSSGLGYASALELAQQDMNLIIVYRASRMMMEKVNSDFEQLKSYGIELIAFNKDATRSIVVDEISQALVTKNIKLHILLHSIAKGNLKPISKEQDSLTSQDFEQTVSSMGLSLYTWSMQLLKKDLFDKPARIISFTSEGGSRVLPGYAAVSAAKTTLESITRSLAVELAPYQITSICIQAGVTLTQSLSRIPGVDQIIEKTKKRNPFNRLTQPQDIARVVELMCDPASFWINGDVIKVDGGEHLR
ncbi:SDR family oxidoreductase [Nonlabens sp. SY33080]|uniref:SDR family oxidoreductase n=1 Tax=Nonlabens sp. SY33080 TaxID=2719911 RepID=UPI001428C4B4|nr:SDR family oxidoreductase [Nonlabens sp. SY33080]